VDMCLSNMSLLLAATGDESLLATIGSYAWMILSVGAGLGFVIFVHELGHFLVAKACGVKCDKFYIGFDVPMPKIFGWQIPSKLVHFQWGETEYGVGILPLGGYVKMLGQDDDPRNAEAEAERTRVATETGQVQLDPRSFPAKSVPARMAIISAGVIMNLIFAVILAAVAYRWGVPETPAVIGSSAPGGPAWTAGIRPGSKIIQLTKNGSQYEHLRFDDLRYAVVINGYDRDLPMLIRQPDGQEVWYEVRPGDRFKKLTGQPTLGVGSQMTCKIDAPNPKLDWLAPKTSEPLVDKDLIVAVDGKPVEDGNQLIEVLASRPKGELTITVERTEKADEFAPAGETSAPKKTRHDIVVQQRPMRELGLTMKIGPVVAVRKNSPADEAVFLPGDVIQAINGEPIGDPLSLGQRLAPTSDPADPITFTVLRKDRATGKPATRELSVTPEMARQLSSAYISGGPTSIESVGIAFDVTSVVESVQPDSPAAKAGLQPGDVITEALFVPADDAKKQREASAFHPKAEPFEPKKIDNELQTWSYVFTRLQSALPDTRVKLTWLRGKEMMSGELSSVASTTYFDETRGINLYGYEEIRTADDWTSAFALGFRETKERLREVLGVLSSLATGRLSFGNLSGPLGIVGAASQFASEGVTKMLIFLTLLSANLAILNFLPIPALDGGHMLFLTAEWIRGKPVDERLQIRLTVAGVLALLSLMVFATVMDIGRYFG
jgi:regulator of sigma E protease